LNTQYSCNNWEYPKATATLAYKNKQETAWTPILVSSYRTKKTKKKGKECSRSNVLEENVPGKKKSALATLRKEQIVEAYHGDTDNPDFWA
jgi:hypothetical protein